MSLLQYTLPPLDQRTPTPPWLLPSFFLLLTSSILLPSLPRKLIITPLVLAYLVTPLYMTGGIDADYQNYTMLVSSALLWIQFGVLGTPEQGLWMTGERGRIDKCSGLGKQLAWSAKLWTTWRGCGWNWQSGKLPQHPQSVVDKRTFLRSNAIRVPYCLLMSQLLLYILRQTPYVRPHSRMPISTAPLPTQVAVVWLAACHTQYNQSLAYRVLTSLLVALDLCSLEECLPLFGNFFGEMYTVGRLWGSCWQSLMRKPNLFLPTLLFRNRRAPATLLRAIVFISSALIHASGAYVAVRHPLGDIRFFLLQFLAIEFENLVMTFGRKWLGIREARWTRALGAVWTLLWFSWSLRLWIGPLLGAGMLAGEA